MDNSPATHASLDGERGPVHALTHSSRDHEERSRRGQLHDEELVQHLTECAVYQDFERAFHQTTGLRLRLLPSTMWLPCSPNGARPPEVCGLLFPSGRACAACESAREKLQSPASKRSVNCHAGLRVIIVPVRAGDHVAAYLHTGHILLHRPSPSQVEEFAGMVEDQACGARLRLKDAYRRSPVISRGRYDGIVDLLDIFAGQLSALSNQIVLQHASGESPFLRRVKAYVAEHLGDSLHLGEVAQAMHVSTFYFCKVFKKETGLTFTDYVGRMRVERTKTMLLDPHRRVSEIAYEVGFGSLTHFNRVFRRLVGQSPSCFRDTAGLQAS